MKKRMPAGVLTLAGFMAIGAIGVSGQTCPACDQDCPSCECMAAWDTGSEATVAGVVSSVERGPADGVHLLLNTEEGDLTVHLGPAWYLDRQDEAFAAGDQVSVTGMMVQSDQGSFLVAREVRKGDEVLTLRAADGYPVWQGWRGGMHMGHHHGCWGPPRGGRPR